MSLVVHFDKPATVRCVPGTYHILDTVIKVIIEEKIIRAATSWTTATVGSYYPLHFIN